MIKVALIGYGKMGRAIERLAPDAGIEVVSRIDPGCGDWSEISEEAVLEAEVCIDFSHPKVVLDNIRRCVGLGKSLVIGTTGWDEHLLEVDRLVGGAGVGAVYASNFSIGMQLFLKIVEEAARLVNLCPDYDISVSETHHKHKADSPSGTALSIAQILLNGIERKSRIQTNRVEGQIDPELLHLSSLRCGSVPGTHTVYLDGVCDQISLTHEARSRDGFALGAIQAAKWIIGRTGLYSLEKLMTEVPQCV